MAYRFRIDEPIEAGFHRILSQQIEKAMAEIEDEGLGVHDTVHQIRKRCKKIRGLARLVRPALKVYSEVNGRFRDLARELAPARDAQTVFETAQKLADQAGDLDCRRICEELYARREAEAGDDVRSELARCRRKLLRYKESVNSWSLSESGFSAIRGGLAKTYGRARSAGQGARREPSLENFHEWRKRVKYHRYHMHLLRDCWKPVMKPLRDQAKKLSDLLGDDHDLGVLRNVMLHSENQLPRDTDLEGFMTLIDVRRKRLQAAARPIGARLFAETPQQYTRRMSRIWRAWFSEESVSKAFRDA